MTPTKKARPLRTTLWKIIYLLLYCSHRENWCPIVSAFYLCIFLSSQRWTPDFHRLRRVKRLWARSWKNPAVNFLLLSPTAPQKSEHPSHVSCATYHTIPYGLPAGQGALVTTTHWRIACLFDETNQITVFVDCERLHSNRIGIIRHHAFLHCRNRRHCRVTLC